MKFKLFAVLFLCVYSQAQVIHDDPVRNLPYPYIIQEFDGVASYAVNGIQKDQIQQVSSDIALFGSTGLWGFSTVWSGENLQKQPNPLMSWGQETWTARSKILDSTPKLVASYEKTAFEGLFFQMDFSRKIWQNWRIGLKTQSKKNDSTSWEYQASVHQPYLSLGRDSSELPINGRTLRSHHFSWSPNLSHQWSPKHISQIEYKSSELMADFPWLETPIPIVNNPTYQKKFAHSPWNATETQHSWRVQDQGETAGWQWKLSHQWGSRNLIESNGVRKFIHPDLRENKDSLRQGQLQDRVDQIEEHLSLSYKTSNHTWGIWAQNQWKWYNLDSLQYSLTPTSDMNDDKQRLGLSLDWVQDIWSLNTSLGINRSSSIQNTIIYSPLAFTNLKLNKSIYQGNFQTEYQSQSPEAHLLYFRNLNEMKIPNANLLPQQQFKWEWNNQIDWNNSLLSWGLKGATTWNPYLPLNRYLGHEINPQTNPYFAFKYYNFDQDNRLIWNLGLGQKWHHWNFKLNYEQFFYKYLTLGHTQKDRIDLPNTLWTGSIVWRDTLLRKKSLDLQIRWDFQRYTSFKDYALDWNKYTVQQVQIPAETMLDFETRAFISSFQLYIQLRNMAHYPLYSQPGITSPGIHMQWGITWAFEH